MELCAKAAGAACLSEIDIVASPARKLLKALRSSRHVLQSGSSFPSLAYRIGVRDYIMMGVRRQYSPV